MKIFEKLNPRQREAVEHVEGPLLVLAGAGSGKTRVLTCRIAYLTKEQGVSPENILAITFTNKAAVEMKTRLEDLLGTDLVPSWVSTFHAACARILRNEIEALGYGRNFVIYDEGDRKALVKKCLEELNIDEQRYPVRAMAAVIGQAKNDLCDAERFQQNIESVFSEKAARVYSIYQQKLRRQNALDFDDLLMQTVILFRQNEEVLRKYRRKFQYILVDEYQDTNHAQYMIVKMLAQEHRNLCVVGDDDQSIYAWRGADIRNILNFERDYPEARVVRLEQNYRSTKVILDAGNAVISRNEGRKQKKLWTERTGGELIKGCCLCDERAEASYIADEIKKAVSRKGKNFNEFAVFYRTHAQSRVLEEIFLREKIPYKIVGGLRFYERKEIKDIIAYLRMLTNPSDDISLERIINVPKRGIGERTLLKIAEYAGLNGCSLLEVLPRAGEIPGLDKRAKKKLDNFIGLVAQWEKDAYLMSVTDLTKKILEESGYWGEMESKYAQEVQSRLENLQEFLSVTREYDREAENPSLEGFLTEISLKTDLDFFEQDGDQVSLMTLHSAKGLEFPVVFMVGMEEGIFPLKRAIEDQNELEEERRLCYVGITRTKESLYFTRARQRTLYGYTCSYLPSRFLKEIPGYLYSEEGQYLKKEELNSSSAEYFANRSYLEAGGKTSETKVDFRPGDKIYHGGWGEGTVVRISGSGKDAKISIAFPDRGIKELMVSFAPIKRI